ncbi:MAG: hypothetical protein JWP26_881 [Devosia sp.]|nr:hypothetical protein [Devosia sp.]
MPKLDALREGIDLYGATAFSIFSIFAPNENTLSRVIVELFDPSGSHGQGLLFLSAMLNSIDVPRVNQREAVRANREVLTRARRRIDIVIETPRYVIGIENKPWAIQQTKQLKDYLDELSADLRGRKPVLIFLSDQEAQSAESDVVKIPYFSSDGRASLYSILQSVVDDIRAARPREFVRDFIGYIDSYFGDGHPMEATDAPYLNAVTAEFDDPTKRKAIAAFLLAQDPLHRRIVNEIGAYFLAEVRTKLSSDFVTSTATSMADCLYNQYEPWGVRRASWPVNCIVAIESQKFFFDQIKFGAKAPDAKRLREDVQDYASPARATLENMTQDIPGGRKTPHWPWEQKVWEPYWGQEFAARLVIQSPTGLVIDHPEVQELCRKFVETSLAVEKRLTGGA